MGLAVLPFIDALITFRKKTVEAYMAELNGLNISFLKIRKDTVWNYAYFPIILESEEELLHVKSALEQENIFPRRYFYPSLNKLPYLRRKFEMPVSESIARRVLCLPLYHDLQLEDRNRITQTIQKTLQ
jgi:dTDP-4-amino-4,6-dideoxygalactose transaminase